MLCMSDLFALWRSGGSLVSKEAIGHAQYIVGGYLVLTSGHGLVMKGSGPATLEIAMAADKDLVRSMHEFVTKEGQELPRGADAQTDLAAYLAMFLKILIDMVVRWMKEKM